LTKAARKAPTPLSLRAYARRRGCSAEAVSKAITTGRLSRSVVRVDGQPKIADPDLADREWAEATDQTRSPLRAADGLKLQEELARAKHWEANLKEQQFREREGELVEAKLVEAQLAEVFTQCRTKLLGVPSRARQLLPHLTNADVAVLEDLQREALQDLVAPGGGE
jgi:hypothetical protein